LNLTSASVHLKADGNATTTNVNALSVTASGTTITIDSVANVTGTQTNHLISYTGVDPYAGLSLAPLPAGYTGNLLDNSGSIDLRVSVSTPPPPVIVTPPAGRAVALGSSVTLSVTASTSTGVTNYQWQINGTNINTATSRTYAINNFQATNAGTYRVIVSDGITSTNSSGAVLTLAVSPVITNNGISGTTLTLRFPSEIGPTYIVQTTQSLSTPNWTTATTYTGDGAVKTFTTNVTGSSQLFIRILLQ
jgi:hypothetical protein